MSKMRFYGRFHAQFSHDILKERVNNGTGHRSWERIHLDTGAFGDAIEYKQLGYALKFFNN
jgi:hypothetical protein